MSSYTCISCRVAFTDGEIQRAHYKTDWHRYNLKRKVADMPPVTAENFQERVLAQRVVAEQQLSEAAANQSCSLCNKKFSSANAFQNHLQSQRHRTQEKVCVAEAQRKVDKMNEKNLEKGLGEEKLDRDARNEALQQAIKEQLRPGPKAQTKTKTNATSVTSPPSSSSSPSSSSVTQQQAEKRQKADRSDKPPRMLWLEEQAKRQNKEDGATAAGEDDWEDVDGEDDEDGMEEEFEEDDDEEEEEEEEDDTMEHTEEGVSASSSSSKSESQPAPLPGSIPITDCLFCPHHSKSLMKNVDHMTRVHGFFIPDVEFLVDFKGLIRYLGEKVGAGNVCLWCNEKGRSFYSSEAVQSHMTDKSHCKLFTDGDAALEFADFYDFRSSYPDKKKKEGEEGEEEEEEEEDEDLPDEKILEYDDETLELTLPSGAKIGHRSLLRYYKQRFGNERAVALNHNRNAVGRVLRHYRALGWGDTGNMSFMHKQKDMQFVQRMKSKWMLKMGMSHNSLLQKHFRAQVIF